MCAYAIEERNDWVGAKKSKNGESAVLTDMFQEDKKMK